MPRVLGDVISVMCDVLVVSSGPR